MDLTEVHQILVVRKDLDREWGSVKVMPSRLQGADDGEEFSIVDVIVSFYWDE